MDHLLIATTLHFCSCNVGLCLGSLGDAKNSDVPTGWLVKLVW